MKAVLTKAVAEIRNRRLQSGVVFVIVALACGTGTLGMSLLFQTQDPYQRAFDAQRGAHLQVFYRTTSDPALLASTPAMIGAQAAAGPWQATDVQLAHGSIKFDTISAIGRDDPGGPVEQLRLVAGRWVDRPGEIVLTRSFAELHHLAVGDRLRVVSIASRTELTVTGEAVDIDEGSADLSSQSSWVAVSQLPALVPTPDDRWYKMAYRFPGTPTNAELQAKLARLKAELPSGTVAGSVNYSLIGSVFEITNTILTSMLLAFSVFALGATALIVANLVTGIVFASTREIGIMKAVGFTPGQVVATFAVQLLLPALAGCVLGIPAGLLASQPLLANSAQALGLAPPASFSPVAALIALVGTLTLVALAAALPALRAGLLQPARVLAVASAPPGTGGGSLRRLAARLRVPRPVSLGVGEAFARPLRGGLTLVAIVLGAATVVVSVGLTASFSKIQDAETFVGRVQVIIARSPAYPDSRVMQLLTEQPETQRVVAIGSMNIAVPGIGDPVNSTIFRGDSSKLGYYLIAGRWFSGPGEVLAPRALLHDAHLKLGDTVIATANGKPLALHVVGEVYSIDNVGHEFIGDWSLLTAVKPDAQPSRYLVTLRAGTDAAAYAKRLAAAEPDFLNVQVNDIPTIAPVKIIDSVLVVLSIVLGLIAAAGIFNTLLLNTRERLRDTAILKAVGMEPRQVLSMVASSAALLALLGGVLALPVGLWLHRVLLDGVSVAAGNDTPPASYAVFGPFELLAVPAGAIAVGLVAALLPARWAARTPVAEVLHSE